MAYYDFIYLDSIRRREFPDDGSALAAGAVDRSDEPPPVIILAVRNLYIEGQDATYETIFEDTRLTPEVRLSIRADKAWNLLSHLLEVSSRRPETKGIFLTIEHVFGLLSDRPVFSTSSQDSQEPPAFTPASMRRDLGYPFLTCHSGGPDGFFLRLKYQSLREAQHAHSAIVALYASAPDDEHVVPNRSVTRHRDETRYRTLQEVMEDLSPDPRPVEPFPTAATAPADTPATSQEPGLVARDPTVLALDYAAAVCADAAEMESEGSGGQLALRDCEKAIRRYYDRAVKRAASQEPSLRLSDLRRIVKRHIASNHRDIQSSSERTGVLILDLAARSLLRSIETELGADLTFPPEMEL